MILSGQIYKCKAGETFDAIALTVYGDTKYASDLLCANPDKCNIQVFAGGEKLNLPQVVIYANNNTMPAKAPWKE